jgi:hypothetical protein
MVFQAKHKYVSFAPRVFDAGVGPACSQMSERRKSILLESSLRIMRSQYKRDGLSRHSTSKWMAESFPIYLSGTFAAKDEACAELSRSSERQRKKFKQESKGMREAAMHDAG